MRTHRRRPDEIGIGLPDAVYGVSARGTVDWARRADEVIPFPASADPAHVDLLAEAVL